MGKYNLPYKKILILENGVWNERENSGFRDFYVGLVEEGVTFKIIDRAVSKDKNEIVQALLWSDALLFSSTFLYEHDVKGIGDLLMEIPKPIVVIGWANSNKPLKYYLEKIWNSGELTKMSHHKVFELVQPDPMDDEDVLEEIDMVKYNIK